MSLRRPRLLAAVFPAVGRRAVMLAAARGANSMKLNAFGLWICPAIHAPRPGVAGAEK
jgi:hypothetical protein